MSVVLRHEVGDVLVANQLAVCSAVAVEVVVGVHVFQQMRMCQIAHATRLPCTVQMVSKRICFLIQFVAIQRFVDAHAPQHHRRVIAVLQNHFFDVLQGNFLPFFVAYVLPPGNFRKHQQPQPVALVKEILRLRVVRGTHCVYTQFVFENLCISPLHAFRHGVAYIGKTLVTVESHYFNTSAVEVETVRCEFRRAHAERCCVDVAVHS